MDFNGTFFDGLTLTVGSEATWNSICVPKTMDFYIKQQHKYAETFPYTFESVRTEQTQPKMELKHFDSLTLNIFQYKNTIIIHGI